jgi:hypothetical protein
MLKNSILQVAQKGSVGFRPIGYADLLGGLPEGVGQEAFFRSAYRLSYESLLGSSAKPSGPTGYKALETGNRPEGVGLSVVLYAKKSRRIRAIPPLAV